MISMKRTAATAILGGVAIAAVALDANAYEVPVEYDTAARTCTSFGVSLWDTRSGEPGVAVSATPGGEGALGASPTDTMTAVFSTAVPATAFDAVVTVWVDGVVNNTVTVTVPAAEGCDIDPPPVVVPSPKNPVVLCKVDPAAKGPDVRTVRSEKALLKRTEGGDYAPC